MASRKPVITNQQANNNNNNNNNNSSSSSQKKHKNSWINLEESSTLSTETNPRNTCDNDEPVFLKLLWMFAGVFPIHFCSRKSAGKNVIKAIPWAIFPFFLLCGTLFCFGDGIYIIYNNVLILTNDEMAREYGINNAIWLNAVNGTWVEAAKDEAKKALVFFIFFNSIALYYILLVIVLSLSRNVFFKRISDKQMVKLEFYSKGSILFSTILGIMGLGLSIWRLIGNTPWFFIIEIIGLSFWLPSFIYTLKMRSSLLISKYKEYYVNLKQMACGTDSHEMTSALLDARKSINEVCTLYVEKPLAANFILGTSAFLFLCLSLVHPAKMMNAGAILPLYFTFAAGLAFLVFVPLWELTLIVHNNNKLYKKLCQNIDMAPEKLGCLLQRFDELCPKVLLYGFQVTPGLVQSAFATGMTPLVIKVVTWLFS
jgi:hypothetical protein